MSSINQPRWVAAAIATCLLTFGAARADSTEPDDPVLARQADVVEAIGVVRYFHPHDAVTLVDWNRVLLEAFDRAEQAADDASFAGMLTDLLAGIGSGIRRVDSVRAAGSDTALECSTDAAPLRWVHTAFSAPPAQVQPGVYLSRRSGAEAAPKLDRNAFSNVMALLPAEPLRGKRFEFSGQARVTDGGTGALWIRVSDADRQILEFDNMGRYPVDQEDWETERIYFAVPDEAEQVAIGMIAHGASRVQFRQLDLREVDPSSDAPVGDSLVPAFEQWQRSSPPGVNDPELDVTEDGLFATLTPGTGLPAVDEATMVLFDGAPPTWRVELADGSALEVPLALCPEEARAEENHRVKLAERFPAADPSALPTPERARLDVATVWPVIQHFYPYRDELDRWPDALTTGLEASRSVDDAEQHRRLLQQMLVRINDGHTRVQESSPQEEAVGWLPISIVAVDDGLAVASSAGADRVAAGDRITAIDGEPTARWLERVRSRYSGSDQWQTHRSIYRLLRGDPGDTRSLTLVRGNDTFEAELSFGLDAPVEPFDHPATRDLADGVVYINLSKISQEQWADRMQDMAGASGIVFDLRGYPGPIGPRFLTHLLESPDDFTGWMQVLLARTPDGDLVTAAQYEWGIPPAEPHLAAPAVFLTNQRAISFSESVLGVVRHNQLGTIVGSNTAGANGNVLPLVLPGGFAVSYTGMRVIGPDGEPFHARGIEPDVLVAPTVEGLREGRDEVLERGIEAIRE